MSTSLDNDYNDVYVGIMEKQVKDQRVTILMSESELVAIDKWAHDNKIKSRGEAIRQMIDGAIKVLPVAKVLRNHIAHHGPDSKYTITALWDLVAAFAYVHDGVDAGFGEADPGYDNVFRFEGGDNEAIMDIMDFVLSGRQNTPLSPRESFVADRIAEGHDDEAIAEIMGLSERAVRTYVGMLLEKTGSQNRDDLVDQATVSTEVRNPSGFLWDP